MLRQLPIRCLLSVISLSLICLYLSASDKGIGVTLVNYTLQHVPNNEVNPGYRISISARVKNFDTIPFSDTLSFGLRNSRYDLTQTSLFGRPGYSGQLIELQGGEEVPAIFSVTIDPSYFIAPGPDVVVVWPISPQRVEDSIMIYLTILDTVTSMNDEPDGNIGYTTLRDRIQLFNTGSEPFNFKQVRFFDLMGRHLSDAPLLINNEIPIPNLPQGIYLCEMISVNGKSKVIKFLR